MLETKKIRLYVEDQIVPSPARKVQMVIDFLTDKNILKFPLEKGKFEDLRVFSINRDWELAFLEENGYVKINLGDLRQWAAVQTPEGLTHVKLELDFVLIDPEFERSRMNLGYIGSFEFAASEELELHITLPLGMKMHEDGKGLEVCLIKKCGEDETKKTIKIPASNVIEKDRKRRYDFLVNKDLFLDSYTLENCQRKFKIAYNVINERKYFLVAVIGLGLLFVALLRLFKLIIGDLQFDIRYLAALVAFMGLFLTILREHYEIPFKKVILFSILFLAIEMVLELIFL